MKFATHKFDDVIRFQRRYGADAATETVTPAPGTDSVTTTPSSSILTPGGISAATETVSTAPPPPPAQKIQVDSAPILPRPATINVIVPPTYSTNLPNTPLGFNDIGARSSGSGSGAGVESPAEKAVSSVKNSGKNIWWLLFLAVAGTGVYIYKK